MNFDIFRKIPIFAKETKEKVSKVITNLQYDEASFFFNDGSTRDVILKDLNSKYESENLNAVKKIIAVRNDIIFFLIYFYFELFSFSCQEKMFLYLSRN